MTNKITYPLIFVVFTPSEDNHKAKRSASRRELTNTNVLQIESSKKIN